MPMSKKDDFGTNADGSRNADYCVHCFNKGGFTLPDMTLEQMIKRIVEFAPKIGMPESKVRAMAKKNLPGLTRWGAGGKKK